MANLGVLAVGDSIINGQTCRQVIHPQSWAQWLAEAADRPFTKYARGGANSAQVVAEQLPRVTSSGYGVAAVTVGANDLLYGHDLGAFEKNLDAILGRLAEVADRVIISNLPAVFRRLPGARGINAGVPEVNYIIATRAVGRALLLDVSDFDGPRLLRPDRVHPTALGQLEMGQRAADLLGVPRLPEPTGGPSSTAYSLGLVRESARVLAKRAIGRP